MKNKINYYLPLAIMLTLLLNSCADATSHAKKCIEYEIKTNSNGYLKLVNFKKVDGVDRQNGGEKIYELVYEAEVEVIKEGGWLNLKEDGTLKQPGLVQPSSFAAFDEECGYYEDYTGPARTCRNTQVKKGQRLKVQNHIYMEKHDSGWKCLR